MGTCLQSRRLLEERKINERQFVSTASFYKIIDCWFRKMPNLFTILTMDIINIIHSYWHIIHFYNSIRIRILLLGANGSGKTTTLKQIRLKYLKQIPDDTLDSYTSYIKGKIITLAKILCKQSIRLFTDNDIQFQSQEFEDIRRECMELCVPQHLTPELAQKIQVIWNEPIIQRTWQQRHKYQIDPKADFFMNKIIEIADDNYTPSNEDYIKITMRTTGYMEERFNVDTECGGCPFIFHDFGGTRAERMKWFDMITDDVKATIYHIAISEYNIMCFEDSTTIRLHEAERLFEQLIDHKFIRNDVKLILLFTQYDLFKEKIKQYPITVAYDDFPIDQMDANNENDVFEFVLNKFKDCLNEKNINLEDIALEWYCVNTTDMDQIGKVLGGITKDLLSSELRLMGF